MRKSSRLSYLFASIAAASLMAACGGGDDDTAAAPAPAPAPAPSPAPTPAPAPAPAPTPAPAPAPAPTPAPAPAPAPTPAPSPAPAPTPAPSPAPAPSAGAASECFGTAYNTAGTTYQLDYAVSGSFTGTSKTTGSVGAATTFNGNSGLTPITQTVVTNYSAPTAVSATTNLTAYQTIDGFDVLSWGSVSSTSVPVLGTMETRTVINPASRDKRFTLAAGGSYTITTNQTTTVTPPGSSSTSNTSVTVTYNGQESVTVPAGTYTSCKFTDSVGNTTWIIKGKGVMAKSSSVQSGGTMVLELQGSSRLNGAAI